MKEVVASGRTVEDAKKEALIELGVESENQVEIEVIDEGSKGVFGWGTKYARVRVRLQAETKSAEKKPKSSDTSHATAKNSDSRKRGSQRRDSFLEPTGAPPVPTVPTIPVKPAPSRIEVRPPVKREPKEKIAEPEPSRIEVRPPVKQEPVEAIVEPDDDSPFSPTVILKKLLKMMSLDAHIEKEKSEGNDIYSIKGNDLGILIGKHGQTLEALQFIVNLIILRNTSTRNKVTIDVEGYRARRERSLRDLARRLAEKAKRERRNVVLEPMLPSERRIIHLSLQKNPHVSTYSQGEEPMRRVIISPRRSGR